MMREHIKISIIIPVFNTEKYLAQCLDSVVCQTGGDIEVICVNDGSTDESGDILKEYAGLYENIITINQQNSGSGCARNNGLDAANGEYALFIDSDDTIEPNTLYNLYDYAKRFDFDAVIFDFCVASDALDNRQKRIRKLPVEIYIDRNTIMDDMVENHLPWGLLFRKTLFDNFRFLSCWREDLALIPVAVSYAEKIGYYKFPVYNYRMRSGSKMRADTGDVRFLDLIPACEYLLKNINPAYYEFGVKTAKLFLKRACCAYPKYVYDFAMFYDKSIAVKKSGDVLNNIPNISHTAKLADYSDCCSSLNGAEIMQWDEKNSNIYETPLTQQAMVLKRFDLVCDYLKLKGLFNFGGNCRFAKETGEFTLSAEPESKAVGEILKSFVKENIVALNGQIKGVTLEALIVSAFIDNDCPIEFYNAAQAADGLKIEFKRELKAVDL